jgi:hypothetical protein
MNKAFVMAVSVFTAGSGALAFDAVDQFNNYQGNGGQGWSYLTGGFYAAQTFKQTANKISGASVYLGTYWGDGNVTLNIYTTNPFYDGGANPLAGASGSVYGTHGNWADVFWSPVNITPGQTYYLNFQGDNNEVITYTTGDTYPNGGLQWSGADYGPNGYDFAFKTWAPVPAPGSAALLGLGGLAASRRRRA